MLFIGQPGGREEATGMRIMMRGLAAGLRKILSNIVRFWLKREIWSIFWLYHIFLWLLCRYVVNMGKFQQQYRISAISVLILRTNEYYFGGLPPSYLKLYYLLKIWCKKDWIWNKLGTFWTYHCWNFRSSHFLPISLDLPFLKLTRTQA